MATRRRKSTAPALLGLLALRPSWTTSELIEQVSRNMRFFWPRAESRVYAEAKALVASGWATALTEERAGRGAPTRTRYRITDAGRQELATWLEEPVRRSSLESESLLRLLLGNLGHPEDLRRAVDAVAADAVDISAVAAVVAEEYLTDQAPFQDAIHARALVFDFLVGYAEHLAAWSERAHRYLDDTEHTDPETQQRHAKELIRTRRVGSAP